MTLYILKLTLAFLSSRFPTGPKSQDENLKISLEQKKDFKVK